MARDFAAVNLAIWQDPDWRNLPADAKLLYLTLWTHPQLDRAGVVDWRPGRIAALIDQTWTADDVRAVADCLEARLFIVTDEQTEECLIRSWVRFDGLLKSPVMSVTFANEYAAVVSQTIRGVIVHELHKLRERQPDLAAWKKGRVLEVLDMPSIDPRSRNLPTDPLDGASTRPVTHPLTPAVTPSVTPSGTVATGVAGDPSPNHPPTPSPSPSPLTPAPSASGRKRPKRPLPDDWTPNDKHREQATAKGLDADQIAFRFRNWAQSNDARYVDWDATFRNWIDRENTPARPAQPTRRASDDWMQST